MFAAFICYLTILLAVGLAAHRKSRSESDFVLGNRSLKFWLVALSAHSSDMSAWLFMGLPAAVFAVGASEEWLAVGLVLGMWANWQFIAPRLRTLTEETESFTLPTFFANRYGPSLRFTSSVFMLIFLTVYLAAGFIAMGLLFESLFDMHYVLGTSIAMGVIACYTLVGGFVAVAWADLFQGVFLLCMVLLVPALAYTSLAPDAEVNFVPSWPTISALMLVLKWGLGYFGQPHIISKFMGIDSVKEMHKAKWLGMSWQVLALSGSICVGLIAIPFFPAGLDDPELIYSGMVKTLFHPFFAGFVLCGVIAANISTMDSQLIVGAATITEDLYRFMARKPRNLLLISRFGVLMMALFAFIIALGRSSTVMEAVAYAWSGLGSAFGPLVIGAIFFKNRSEKMALVTLVICGAIGAIGPLILETVPAIVVAFLVGLPLLRLSKT